MSLAERIRRWHQVEPTVGDDALRVALLSTFTIDPLVPMLGAALADVGLPAKIQVGPYQQIVQECLTPGSATESFGPDVVVVWPRLEEIWAGLPWPLVDEPSAYEDAALELADYCIDGARQWGATLVFILPSLPQRAPLGVGDSSTDKGVAAVAEATRRALQEQLTPMSGTILYDAERALRWVGAAHAFDPRLDALGHIPFSMSLMGRVGEDLANLLRIQRKGAKKAVIVDADNTLWGGVVGEDGPERLELSERGPGHGHTRLQSYLIELRRAGVLLALCSKNAEEDVWRAFERREMRLEREHLAAWRIGWEPKSFYVREIAEELNIGLDAVVFIDDNPVELEEVRCALPEVTCLRMPRDSADWGRAIADTGILDRLRPTRDDLRRADDATANRARRASAQAAKTPEEHLAQLQVETTIRTATRADLPRVTQLITKTNQFNLNCRRRSEAEVAELAERDDHVIRVVEVRDRFGDSGLVGLYILELGDAAARLDTFLLSCRALGRRVEHAMMASAVRDAEGGLEITMEEHPRNEPLRRFLSGTFGLEVGKPTKLQRAEWPEHVGRGETES